MLVVSAPWLLGGLLIAGVLHVFMPQHVIARYLKKPGFGSVVRASLIGLPLPLCSCSVIPVGVSLRRSGASRGATASFFVSTPEIGVDSFLLSYGLLGAAFTYCRMFAAFVSAMLAGILVDLFSPDDTSDAVAESEVASGDVTIGSSPCCASDTAEAGSEAVAEGLLSQVRAALRYGFGTMADDLARPLVFGFLLAGLVSSIIPEDFFLKYQFSPLTSMLLVLLVSLPVYVCSTSSTPLAAALVAKGMFPGAAVVFLLAGPATNIATVLVLRQELGNRACAAYLASVTGVALCVGYLVPGDWISTGAEALMHDHGASFGELLAASLLCALLIVSLLRKSSLLSTRSVAGEHSSPGSSEEDSGEKSCCAH